MWPFDRQRKLREFVQGLGVRQTPDVAELEESKYRLVFICDDLQRAHKNYSLIKDHSTKVTRGFTRERFDYRVGKHTGRGLPFLDKDGLRVKGEVHAVRTHHIAQVLDKHYNNGVEFARVHTQAILTDRQHKLLPADCQRFLMEYSSGSTRTLTHRGLTHYLSHRRVSLLRVDMYVALKSHWVDQPNGEPSYPKAEVNFPKHALIWLPKYYKYPINRNRCLK